MYSFEYPELFIVVPFIVYCLFRCKEKHKTRYFVHLNFFTSIKGRIDKEFWYKLGTLFWLVTALTSPVFVDIHDPNNRNGIALVLVVDGSGSMVGRGFDTEDVMQTKFESVKTVMRSFIEKRVNDNIGVVLFGDFAFTASPLTYEKAALLHMIDYLTRGMAGENTAIGDGLDEALKVLSVSKAKQKVVVLLTDGMYNAGSITPKDALQKAIKQKVKIYTIGMGKSSDYNEKMLKAFAQKSKGAFFQAQSKEDLVNVYNQINTLERSAIRSKDYHFKTYYFWIPSLLALLFFVAFIKRRVGL